MQLLLKLVWITWSPLVVGGPCYVQSPIQVTGFLCSYKTTARNVLRGSPSVKLLCLHCFKCYVCWLKYSEIILEICSNGWLGLHIFTSLYTFFAYKKISFHAVVASFETPETVIRCEKRKLLPSFVYPFVPDSGILGVCGAWAWILQDFACNEYWTWTKFVEFILTGVLGTLKHKI